MKNNLIYIVSGALAILYLRGRNLLRKLAYKIAGVQLVSITAEEIKLNINLLINNPTNIQVMLGNFIANVYINGAYVGNINYPVNRYLLSGINNITVGLTLNPTTVGNVLWMQLQSGNIYNMVMDIDGSIDVDNKTLKASARFIMQDFWNFNR